MPQTWQRRKKNKTRDIPKIVNEEDYPDYYLQNFHHQTDGYLSDHSAEIYDLQVEILFSGTADSMRRRVLSPLKKGLYDLIFVGHSGGITEFLENGYKVLHVCEDPEFECFQSKIWKSIKKES